MWYRSLVCRAGVVTLGDSACVRADAVGYLMAVY